MANKIACENCGKIKQRIPSRVKRYKHTFCSHKCRGIWARAEMTPARVKKIATYGRYYAKKKAIRIEYKIKLLSITNPKWNNPKYIKKQQEARKARKALVKERANLNHKCRRFGISVDEYLEMVAEQQGRCAICKRIPVNRLAVDHCHKSNKVRGLLCQTCNSAIGLFKENIEALYAAIRYIKTQGRGTKTVIKS